MTGGGVLGGTLYIHVYIYTYIHIIPSFIRFLSFLLKPSMIFHVNWRSVRQGASVITNIMVA